MGDPLTERERRHHLYTARIFDRLASRQRRRSVLEGLGKALDRYRALLDRRENDTDQVEGEGDAKRRSGS